MLRDSISRTREVVAFAAENLRIPDGTQRFTAVVCSFCSGPHGPLWRASIFPGGYAGGATPVPIPNTEVKSSRADGTAGETLWESRTPPGLLTARASARLSE